MEVIVPKLKYDSDSLSNDMISRLKELSNMSLTEFELDEQLSGNDGGFIFIGPIILILLPIQCTHTMKPNQLMIIDDNGYLPNMKGIFHRVVIGTKDSYNEYSWLSEYNKFDRARGLNENCKVFDSKAFVRLLNQLIAAHSVYADGKMMGNYVIDENDSVTIEQFNSEVEGLIVTSADEYIWEHYGLRKSSLYEHYLLDFYEGLPKTPDAYSYGASISVDSILHMFKYYIPNRYNTLYSKELYKLLDYNTFIGVLHLDYLEDLLRLYDGKKIEDVKKLKHDQLGRDYVTFINNVSSIIPAPFTIGYRYTDDLKWMDCEWLKERNSLKLFFRNFIKKNRPISVIKGKTRMLPCVINKGRNLPYVKPKNFNELKDLFSILNIVSKSKIKNNSNAVSFLNEYFNNTIDELLVLIQLSIIDNEIDNYLSWNIISLSDECFDIYDSIFKFNKFLNDHFNSDIDDRSKAFLFIFGVISSAKKKGDLSKLKFNRFELGYYDKDKNMILLDVDEFTFSAREQNYFFELILLKKLLVHNYLEV